MRWILDSIDRIIAVVVAGLVIATAIAVGLNVFFRYVLHLGLVWADEVPGFLLVWIAFLGAYLAYRRDGHIAFDMLLDKLPRLPRRIAHSLIDALVAALFIMLGVLSWRMISVVGGREIETLEIPQGVFMAILPVSSALIVLALIGRILERLASPTDETGA